MIHRLLGKEPGQRYQSAGGALADVESIAVALSHGVAEPMVVIGLHDRRSMLAEPAFVGRQTELAILASHLDQAGRGAGGLVTIDAESGGGKTRLLEELAARASRLGTWILQGNGVDQAAQRPYPLLEGVADGIVEAAAHDPNVAIILRDRLADRAEAVAVALPELHELLGQAEPDELPEAHGEARSLAALTVLIDALGTPARPALVLLDDCQWADGLTAQLLTSTTPVRRGATCSSWPPSVPKKWSRRTCCAAWSPGPPFPCGLWAWPRSATSPGRWPAPCPRTWWPRWPDSPRA
ncbi:MAG: ATP-binding protein, partial [Acidimicrobiales bacterium]